MDALFQAYAATVSDDDNDDAFFHPQEQRPIKRQKPSIPAVPALPPNPPPSPGALSRPKIPLILFLRIHRDSRGPHIIEL